VPGDVIELQEGDSIPADSRVVQAACLRVNNATVTGESVPHSRDAAPQLDGNGLENRNTLLAGTSVVSGEGRALVFATGPRSNFGEIARLALQPRESRTPLQKEIARLSRLIATLSVGIGVVFYIVGQQLGLPFWENFIFAIGIIVANVPEGLLPTMTLALAMGAQRMARRKALIRHLPAVETLGSTTVICTDKTGTLTVNRMAVKRVFLGSGCHDVAYGVDLEPLVARHAMFFEVARYCQTLHVSHERSGAHFIGDPMEIALVELAQRACSTTGVWPRLGEIPFDAQRSRLSTVHATATDSVMLTKGAPEAVFELCTHVDLGSGPEPFTSDLRQRYTDAQEKMAGEGLRVLAFASRSLEKGADFASSEKELVLCGLVGLEDPPRPEVAPSIGLCREAGIKVIMVTGDHPHTAVAIGREIGLIRSPHPRVITGEALRHLTSTQLQLALDAPEILFARVTADQKMRVVEALKHKREIVAVTGDGVNDAPALKKADIGIAMGLSGTDVARESADMILLDDNFATIVAAIEEGRAVFANIRKFLTYILTSNVPELVPYLAFVLFKIPLPLTIIQILAVDLGTDMLPGLALGAERPNPSVMRRPPRTERERLVDLPLIVRAYLWLGPIQAIGALASFFFVLKCAGWHMGQVLAPRDPLYLQATTACLSAIIVTQVANLFACRSERDSMFRFGLWSNPLICWGIAAEVLLILCIDYTPVGNAIFGTAPIPLAAWLFALPFAFALLALEELRKWLVRHFLRPPTVCLPQLRHEPAHI
jgi:calcium-translocating P-type ATPase